MFKATATHYHQQQVATIRKETAVEKAAAPIGRQGVWDYRHT